MKRGIVAGAVIAITAVACNFMFTTDAFAAKKTAANLAASVPNAKANFIDHESTCTTDLNAARASLGNNRSAVNESAPYKYNNWISLRNNPDATTTGLYPAGNVSVPLQFNQYLFLCGVVVSPASGGATSPTANRVTNSRYPNDRNPVRTGTINRADLVQKDAKVISASVVGGGGSITNMVGQKRNVRSFDDSRYSAGTTLPFTYNGNLSSTTTITIRLVIREVRSYYAVPTSSSATVTCDYSSGGNLYTHYVSTNGVSNIDQAFNDPQCNRDIEKDYTIQIRVTPPPQWTISGTTTMRVNGATRNGTFAAPTAARIGDKINWTQTLRNNGPRPTDRRVTASTLVRDYDAGNNALLSSNLFNTTAINPPWASGATRSWQNGNAGNGFTYTIRATTYRADGSVNVKGDVGKKLCRNLQWNPTSWNDTNAAVTSTAQRCVSVPYYYNLSPDLNGPSGSITLGGTIPDIYPTIRNEVPGNSSRTTETPDNVVWELGRIDIAPGGTVPVAGTNGQTPQSYYGSNWDRKDNGTRSFPPGSTLLNLLRNETVPLGTPIGTKICFTLSVRPYSPASNNWRHGEPLCIGVNAQPTVQVLGNDLRVGSAFQGGTNTNASIKGIIRPNTASWGEYGVISPSTVTNFASQSGGNGGATGTMNSWSKLTFSNTGTAPGCGGNGGCFTGATNLGSLPNVRSAVAGVTYNGAPLSYNRGNASFNISSLPSIIPGATLANFNQSAAIVTSGTITIDADVVYANSLASGDAIPQLILIANNITIHGNVSRIDAWLIATGTINTCDDVAQTALRSTNCNNQLTVRGAVMANQLLMNRTYFDTTDPSKSAETFNLQGSSYVWASNVARQNGVWQTVYSTDLPPRY